MMNNMERVLFENREISWLKFNLRVLEEAEDLHNPLLERLKFIAITASNLDEFFMVRVAGLKDQVNVGFTKRDPAGLNPKEQLQRISEEVHEMVRKQYNVLLYKILPELEKKGISFVKYNMLGEDQKDSIKKCFQDVFFAVLTPMAVDKSRPFPLVANKTLNLGVRLMNGDEERFAVVQVPSVLPRIIKIPGAKTSTYIFLEDIIIPFIDQLFQGNKVISVHPFRVTRNGDLTLDEEEAEDLLLEIQKSIKRRKWGEPVRLEVSKDMDRTLKNFLIQMLEVEEEDIYEEEGPLDLTAWMKFSHLEGYDRLRDEPLPSQPAQSFFGRKDIFEVIREKDCLVHHPYESFDCVLQFVEQAARDPKVLAIKQTLYRVSGDSPIVKALIEAAENGKQVTVLVELKARFDEENNIIWAKRLEQAGCHVIYGLVGLKIHCKTLLIVRKEEDGIRRYVHLGTGNYNDSTAKLYTDIGMFTCRETFGADVSALFNLLTGFSQPPQWKKIEVAPGTLRPFFIKRIEREIDHALQGKEARIIAKMNSLVDKEIIEYLYKASQTGVKITLIIRGICCLRSAIKNISDNIEVISIVGRFLEHSRIFYFLDGGREKIYLSSADWMPRNLDRRVETLFPVEQDELRMRVKDILDETLRDTMKARIQQPDGTYTKTSFRSTDLVESQKIFHEKAKDQILQLEKDLAEE